MSPDDAAGIRGTISKLERLTAPPTQEDAPVLPAEQGSTSRGPYMLALQADLAGLERTDPAVAAAAERLQETVSRLGLNIHQVRVSGKRLECAKSCGGPAPHLSEYRAADVRPSTEQTAGAAKLPKR